MATLVLTVVGGAIGGPIGAALGAVIGQQLDASILKPKGREGPRLTELRVQSSTYGQPIPKLFGTMRVAGSVIWATDLREIRNITGGGSSGPIVTSFTYSVSVAVALSSRPIRGVKRIWADGNLLRTADGRFRERCKFRVHLGGQDQVVDPLIASALGADSASAFRGLGYVVLEGLELAAFGNRIPSLTFEVEADDAAVDSGMIGDELLGTQGRCFGQWPIQGFAASGDKVRDAMAPLADMDRLSLVSGAGAWRLAPPNMTGTAAQMAQFARAGRIADRRDILERVRRPLAALPGRIRVRHYEAERDYQAGQQMSAVAGGGMSEQAIDVPAVMPASSARALAAWLAAAASDGREIVQWQADLASLALTVGGLIQLADGSQWRVAGRLFRDNEVTVELARHRRVPPPVLGADGGAAIPAPEWPEAQGILRLFDGPPPDGGAAQVPQIIMAAAGDAAGWRGADCWFVASQDAAPVMLGTLRAATASGELAQAAGAGTAHLVDRITRLYVRLDHDEMSLQSVDEAQLLAGANRALLGGELIQFGSAVLDGEDSAGRTWIVSNLLRARGGHGGEAGHAAGTGFVLLGDPALMTLPDSAALTAAQGGAFVEWAERNETEMTRVAVPLGMAAVRPLSPVHGRARRNAEGGLDLMWVRRSRSPMGWRDEVDMPLGESVERWRIMLNPPVPNVGPWESGVSHWTVDAADLAQIPSGTEAEIAQIGDFAMSPHLKISLALGA